MKKHDYRKFSLHESNFIDKKNRHEIRLPSSFHLTSSGSENFRRISENFRGVGVGVKFSKFSQMGRGLQIFCIKREGLVGKIRDCF